jgi:hypothetical protein
MTGQMHNSKNVKIDKQTVCGQFTIKLNLELTLSSFNIFKYSQIHLFIPQNSNAD